ncbi:TLD-domain-containing protein [Entophlyctis helioformis]|nr:TLD-domain-containing protein [Entophlyctis helioformis]
MSDVLDSKDVIVEEDSGPEPVRVHAAKGGAVEAVQVPAAVEAEVLAHLPPPPSVIPDNYISPTASALDVTAGSDHHLQTHTQIQTQTHTQTQTQTHTQTHTHASTIAASDDEQPHAKPLLSLIFGTGIVACKRLAALARRLGIPTAPVPSSATSPPAVSSSPTALEPMHTPSMEPMRSAPISVATGTPSLGYVASGPLSTAGSAPASSAAHMAEHASLSSFIWDFIGLGTGSLSPPGRGGGQALEEGVLDLRSSSAADAAGSGVGSWTDSNTGGGSEVVVGSAPSDIDAAYAMHALTLNGRSSTVDTVVLTFDIASEIHSYLPPLVREASSLDLVYSIEQHGISLNTLYGRCAEVGPCLVAIRDENGNVFGAFGSQELAVAAGYFGNGSCFLWKKNSETGEVSVYPATGKNDYLMLCESHCIALVAAKDGLVCGSTTSCTTDTASRARRLQTRPCQARQTFTFLPSKSGRSRSSTLRSIPLTQIAHSHQLHLVNTARQYPCSL